MNPPPIAVRDKARIMRRLYRLHPGGQDGNSTELRRPEALARPKKYLRGALCPQTQKFPKTRLKNPIFLPISTGMQNSGVPASDTSHSSRMAALTARVERIRMLNLEVHERRKTAAETAGVNSAGRAGRLVDQLAFQTNLTLLAAAVEAAQQGVDFGSFMDEVRTSAAAESRPVDETLLLVRRFVERLRAPADENSEPALAVRDTLVS